MRFVFLSLLLSNFIIAYSQTISFEIYAKDLSEDATAMSSHNDELVLLVYEQKEINENLKEPVFLKSFTLDTVSRKIVFDKVFLPTSSYLLFLLENDDDKPTQQIDPVLRVYWEKIIKKSSEKNYEELFTYLGDNELLGYSTFRLSDINKTVDIEIKGRQSLDSYHYLIKVR